MSSLYSRLTNCLPVDVQRSRLVSIRLDDCRILDAFAAVALQYVGIRSDSLARSLAWYAVAARSQPLIGLASLYDQQRRR